MKELIYRQIVTFRKAKEIYLIENQQSKETFYFKKYSVYNNCNSPPHPICPLFTERKKADLNHA
jgi:hypothetical protein